MKGVAVLASAFLSVAVWGADPLIGTWKVNYEKSKYDPGPPSKSATAVHSEDGDFIVTKTEGVSAKGQPYATSSRWKKDGQHYAITGSTTWDTLAARRVNDRTTEFTFKKGGKVVSTSRVVVSRDGKIATATSKGTNAEGKPFNNRVISEKQ